MNPQRGNRVRTSPRRRSRWSGSSACVVLAWALAPQLLGATTVISLPNPSFEEPSTLFVSTEVGSWKKSPKPDDYDEGGGVFLWDQLVGVFKNTAPEKPDHIVNLDRTQALYLFANPRVGVFLDATGPGGSFPYTYQPGDSLTLTVAVLGGGGGMLEGTPLRLELYHLGGDGERFLVSGTTVLHSRQQFPTTTQFFDFEVTVPQVRSTDPWANRRIGIGLLSALEPNSEIVGGYWDLDNVRLTVSRDDGAFLLAPATVDGERGITWKSSTGHGYQVQISSPLGSWTNWGSLLSGTGADLTAKLPPDAQDAIFVRVVASPQS